MKTFIEIIHTVLKCMYPEYFIAEQIIDMLDDERNS